VPTPTCRRWSATTCARRCAPTSASTSSRCCSARATTRSSPPSASVSRSPRCIARSRSWGFRLADERDTARKTRELSELIGLDAEKRAERLAFYDISPADEAHLAKLAEICDPHLERAIADFYAHLLRFPELEEMLRAGPDRVQ